MATQKISDYSMRALPFLIHKAQQRETLTYKELTDYVGCHHRVAGHILGYIRDDICTPRNLPFINAIVIRQDTLEPGDGWLPEGTSHLSKQEYKEQYELFRDRAFAFPGWNDLLKDLSLSPIQITEQELKDRGRTYSQVLARQGGGGEGAAHRDLKEYIARNPEAIGVQVIKKGEQEHMFISGDCCDILFTLMDKRYAIIEIKNGDPGELVRGIYQLVKYRALLSAEEDLSDNDPPQTLLVAYQIALEVQTLASKFNISCHVISKIPKSE